MRRHSNSFGRNQPTSESSDRLTGTRIEQKKKHTDFARSDHDRPLHCRFLFLFFFSFYFRLSIRTDVPPPIDGMHMQVSPNVEMQEYYNLLPCRCSAAHFRERGNEIMFLALISANLIL